MNAEARTIEHRFGKPEATSPMEEANSPKRADCTISLFCCLRCDTTVNRCHSLHESVLWVQNVVYGQAPPIRRAYVACWRIWSPGGIGDELGIQQVVRVLQLRRYEVLAWQKAGPSCVRSHAAASLWQACSFEHKAALQA